MAMKQRNALPDDQIAPSPPAAVRRARRVMLVDNSAAQRRLLLSHLTRAGYEVVEVSSGEQALGVCAVDPPDFIISGWVMAGMSGPDLCRAVRALAAERYIYFILLTASAQPQDAAFGLLAGADDYVRKPIAASELLARLTAGDRILQMEERLTSANLQLRTALHRLRLTQDDLDRDLREARKIQQGLVRERQARVGGFDLALLMRPAGHIGGDLVGFRAAGPGRAVVYSIDVSGSGITSALLTARLAAYLSGADVEVPGLGILPPPEKVVRQLNRMMMDEVRTDAYFTMVHAELEVATGRVKMVQAGHPHPMLQRADGTVMPVGVGGMPVGVFDEADFSEIELTLEPGDRLFIASDGVSEAMRDTGEMLGEEGLTAIMRTNAPLRKQMFLESLCWSLAEYSGGRRLDDVSAVLVEYRPDEGDQGAAAVEKA